MPQDNEIKLVCRHCHGSFRWGQVRFVVAHGREWPLCLKCWQDQQDKEVMNHE